jgi:hypothetical protein
MSETRYITPPEYIINCDLPPHERWKHIAMIYRDQMRPLAEYIQKQMRDELGSCGFFATSVLAFLQTHLYLHDDFRLELEGIAEITEQIGLGYDELLAFNIGYDFLAYCTSISTKIGSDDGAPWHLRNMDWDKEIADCLGQLTITAVFQKRGNTIYRATTWVGMIGLLTACSSKFSISLNYRHVGETLGIVNNVLSILAGLWPIALLLRFLLDHDLEYDSAIMVMQDTKIASPCYLVITGIHIDQGIILTRERTGTLRPIDLSDRDFLVQTNIDHWVNHTDPEWAGTDVLLQNALERRVQAEQNLQNYEPGTDFKAFALKILSKYPTCNDQTVYQVVMHPASGLYEARVVINPPSQFSHARHADLKHLDEGHYQPDYDEKMASELQLTQRMASELQLTQRLINRTNSPK